MTFDQLTTARPPLILLGMHRSGTTLLARMLDAMGVHIGADHKNETSESEAFRQVNIRVLSKLGAAWHKPEPLWRVFKDRRLSNLVTATLGRHTKSPAMRRYVGRVAPRDTVWGWKDPRNTLLFPYWQKVFPTARVIHIVRNGVDVAESLRQREEVEHPLRTAARKLAYPVYPWRWPEYNPQPFRSHREAFDLWDEYLKFADHARTLVAADNWLELRYEDLLAEPALLLPVIANFAGVETSPVEVAQLAKQVDAARRFPFTEKPELAAFYEQVQNHQTMQRYQYDAIETREPDELAAAA